MADEPHSPRPPFLHRWSQRKLAAAREAEAAATTSRTAEAVPATTPAVSAPPVAAPAAAAPELPAVDSLSFESDFTAFLAKGVDPDLKRAALKKLFADPRFNVMDGLDVYIDDYTKFEPIPPEVMAKLNQARYLFDPPKTRVNPQGEVEDVPDEPATATTGNDPALPCAESVDIASTPASNVDTAPPAAELPNARSEKSR